MNIRVIRRIAAVALIIIGVCLIPKIFNKPDLWYMIKWLVGICALTFVPAYFLLRMKPPQ